MAYAPPSQLSGGSYGAYNSDTAPLTQSVHAISVPSAVALPDDKDMPSDNGTHLRDWPFAVAFWAHLLVIAGVAFSMGVKAVKDDASSAGSGSSSGSGQPAALDLNASTFVRAVCLAVFCGGLAAAVFFWLMQRHASTLIRTSLLISVAFQIISGVCLIVAAPIAGVLLIIFGLLTLAYMTCIRNRIAFATAHVECAMDAIKGAKGVVGVALGVQVMAGVWCMLWGLAALGLEHAVNNGSGKGSTGNGGALVVFVMLVSLLWTSATLKNVVAFCAASVTGDWWFHGPAQRAPVKGALKRAFTTSFGSLSLGALLVAVITAARGMADAARRRRNGGEGAGAAAAAFAACLLSCFLAILEAIAEWANHWAIPVVAITGLSFRPAGQYAFSLFARRGWTAIINQDLVGMALALGSLASGAVAGVAGGGLTYATIAVGAPNRGLHAGLAAALCFFVGIAMAHVLSTVVVTAVRGVFVCWAVSPGALANTHPERLQQLANAWQQTHPSEFSHAGYTQMLTTSAAVLIDGSRGGPGSGGMASMPVPAGMGYGAMPAAGAVPVALPVAGVAPSMAAYQHNGGYSGV